MAVTAQPALSALAIIVPRERLPVAASGVSGVERRTVAAGVPSHDGSSA